MFLSRGRGRGVGGRGSWPCHGGGRTPHLASRRLARVVTAEFTGNGGGLAASFTTPIRAVRGLLPRIKIMKIFYVLFYRSGPRHTRDQIPFSYSSQGSNLDFDGYKKNIYCAVLSQLRARLALTSGDLKKRKVCRFLFSTYLRVFSNNINKTAIYYVVLYMLNILYLVCF